MRLGVLACLFLSCITCAWSQSTVLSEQSPSASATISRASGSASGSSTRASLFIPSSTPSSSLDSRRPMSGLNSMGGTYPTPSPEGPPKNPKGSRPPSLARILFAVLGGLVFVTLLVALARFLVLRKRAPIRDRAADERDKHILYQEISEMQRNSLIGRPYNFEPPPVYLPPPPTYDASTTSTVRSSLATSDDGYIGYIPRRDSPPLSAPPGRPSWERRNSDNPTLPLLGSDQRAGGSTNV